jgi:hypothetical protein
VLNVFNLLQWFNRPISAQSPHSGMNVSPRMEVPDQGSISHFDSRRARAHTPAGRQHSTGERSAREVPMPNRIDSNLVDYSSTTKLPFILTWPNPQNTEQRNGKVPVLSGVNSTVAGTPFLMV